MVEKHLLVLINEIYCGSAYSYALISILWHNGWFYGDDDDADDDELAAVDISDESNGNLLISLINRVIHCRTFFYEIKSAFYIYVIIR